MFLKFFIVGIIMQASYGIGPFLFPLGIKNKPFSGEFETVNTKKLPNGDVTQTTGKVKIYRLTDGSTRFEDYGREKEGGKIYAVSIYNHEEQKFYLLDVESKSVYTMPESEPANEPNSEPELPVSTDKSIGKKVIENLVCLGYQRNRAENDTFEYWMSEELNQIVLAKSVSGSETNTLRLFDVKRSEPDSKMFVVPKDYKPMKIE